MTDPILEAEGLTKRYRRGRRRHSLGRALPGRRGLGGDGGFAAIDGVTFAVDAGESVGIIGPNGAGKSTLLKLIAGTVEPTEGRIRRRGRLGAMIELGVGFHPDLTGRENVRLTGALLGLRRAELTSKLDRIVDLAGIGDALDTPVKRYSSGMEARLGFAVAAQADADLLLVDEVLSVGDAEFRRRCYEQMVHARERGATLLFVSHNLWLVAQLCERTIWIEHGVVVEDGPTEGVVERYAEAHRLGGPVRRDLASVRGVVAEPAVIEPGDPIDVEGVVEVHEPAPSARLVLELRERVVDPDTEAQELLNGPGRVWLVSARLDVAGVGSFSEPGRFRFRGRLESVPFAPMELDLAAVIVDPQDQVIDQQVVALDILGEARERFLEEAVRWWLPRALDGPRDQPEGRAAR